MNRCELRQAEVQVFRNVVSATGRDPAEFAVEMHPDGQVHVTGPQGSACYAAPHWISRFSRHLERGFYDARVQAAPPGTDPLAARQGTSGRAST